MIKVILNKDKFKYDIHSLVKAFYPKEDVSVLTRKEDELQKNNTINGLP